MTRGITLAATLLCLAVSGCGTTSTSSTKAHPQIFEDMGDYDHSFTTSSEEADEYLIQGRIWTQAFNYDEATRSYREAARLDPDCAMAWWGVAYSEGPSYNHPEMTPERQAASWEAIQNALALIDNTTPLERALIEALQHRFANPYPEEHAELDEAYADAMGEVWEQYPNDADVGMLYAEARMVLRPWQLYNEDREPAEGTLEIEALLERVLALDPDLPGACHLYIHAVELSETPERGLPAANRLSTHVPLSGHLLHMPAHIYTRTGDWDRAREQNALAMEADDRYRAKSPDQITQHMYMVHNSHIRAYASMMTGHEAEAMHASRKMWSDIPDDKLELVAPHVDAWMCSVYDVQKRFGRWDELLAEPPPPEYMPFTSAMWRAHRAIAYAAKHEFEAAERELAAYHEICDNIQAEDLVPRITVEAARGRLSVIEHFVPGEIALQRGDLDLAIEHLEKAVEAEDKLGYNGEPPDYLQPIRHTLGAVYLKAGRLEDAERAYREDLAEFPGNGWSLYGLGRVLRSQGRTAEAEQVEEEFARAWSGADEPITTSCMCIPTI
ncbi:MAG: tetratricopeptide repeat protein [Planctomycetota bacterium]|nr:MAG: tetratricopeptide repeat protein [Planctomycetota bacterium]